MWPPEFKLKTMDVINLFIYENRLKLVTSQILGYECVAENELSNIERDMNKYTNK